MGRGKAQKPRKKRMQFPNVWLEGTATIVLGMVGAFVWLALAYSIAVLIW
jgi:hypothetical protein